LSKVNSVPEFSVAFWGVRGTLASPGPAFRRTGGNTICAGLTCGDRLVVFDAGTGIRELGSRLLAQDKIRHIDLMLTHVHYDHVEGVPFFGPFFSPDFKIDVWLGRIDGAETTEAAVKGLMRRPYFPVGPDVFRADVHYRRIQPFAQIDLGDGIAVRTAPLNHPGGATAYRVDFHGKSFAFVTDVEHEPGKSDPAIVELIRNVSMFAYDSSFTDEELSEYRGYGHSTWEEGLRLRAKANAHSYLAIHHMPFRTDKEIDQIEAKIRKQSPKSGVAREGDVIAL
jgi:phosphoribosyl 1,2-cyclic phosphodiesterase